MAATTIPSVIESPDGIRTTLTIDPVTRELDRVTYPDGTWYGFTYTENGLMTGERDPEQNSFTREYETINDTLTHRISAIHTPDGGDWLYSRSSEPDGTRRCSVTTGEGNVTAYEDMGGSAGFSSVITDAAGFETTYSRSGDRITVEKSLHCGWDLTFVSDIDRQYRYPIMKEMTRETAGITHTMVTDRLYEDTDADDIPDRITRPLTVGDRVHVQVTDTIEASRTLTTPEGRNVTLFYDPVTLDTQTVSVPGLHDLQLVHDERGRVREITVGDREMHVAYADAPVGDRTATVTDGATTVIHRDDMDRVFRVDPSLGPHLAFGHDANANTSLVRKPAPDLEPDSSSWEDHVFSYTCFDAPETYDTPLGHGYTWSYDRDRRVSQLALPSGAWIEQTRANDRLEEIDTSDGDLIDIAWQCATRPAGLGRLPSGGGTEERIDYAWNEALLAGETMSGTLNAAITWGDWDGEFRPRTMGYAGTSISLEYDADGLLSRSGAFTIGRHAGNGLPLRVAGQDYAQDRTFNGYGELSAVACTMGGTTHGWSVGEFSPSGRIVRKQETIGGESHEYVYAYDAMGRLLGVTRDGVQTETYTYWENGTRKSDGTHTCHYSRDDELLSVGDTTFTYTPDGYLRTKTTDGAVTTYTYSPLGELLSVDLPDADDVSYVYDPLGRRIARLQGGVITDKYLWQGLTRLLAVYNADDTLRQRFLYADGRMPVAMQQDGQTYYLIHDQVGSLKAVLDTTGTVVKRVDYDSFGVVLADSNPAFAMPLGFAGGLADPATGLVRFGVRDYDPGTGRWTAKDPILFAGGDTDLYGYCLNDPVNLYDFNGLAWRQQRPIDIWGLRHIMIGPSRHERFLFSDGSESGYYNDSCVREDRANKSLQSKYENVGEYLNDDILRLAIRNIRPMWDIETNPNIEPYDEKTRNCQDYCDAVLDEYYRILELIRSRNHAPCK